MEQIRQAYSISNDARSKVTADTHHYITSVGCNGTWIKEDVNFLTVYYLQWAVPI